MVMKMRERVYDVPVTVTGSEWGDDVVDRLSEHLQSLATRSVRPVRRIHLTLDRLINRSVELPFSAIASFEVDGHPLYAHAEADSAERAASLLEFRISRQLEHARERRLWFRRHGGGEGSVSSTAKPF